MIWLDNSDPIDTVIFEKNFEFFGAWIFGQDTFNCLKPVIVFEGKDAVDSDVLVAGVIMQPRIKNYDIVGSGGRSPPEKI